MKSESDFWNAVDCVEYCLEWQNQLNGGGYGQTYWRGKTRLAHRVAFEIVNGLIPPGLMVLHRCDNRKCCNPSHHFLGNNADNMADMVAKGRSIGWQSHKTECKNGHLFTHDNLIKTKRGERRCKECARADNKARYHAKFK